jgi:hypothetical protein
MEQTAAALGPSPDLFPPTLPERNSQSDSISHLKFGIRHTFSPVRNVLLQVWPMCHDSRAIQTHNCRLFALSTCRRSPIRTARISEESDERRIGMALKITLERSGMSSATVWHEFLGKSLPSSQLKKQFGTSTQSTCALATFFSCHELDPKWHHEAL